MNVLLTTRMILTTLRVQVNEDLVIEAAESAVNGHNLHLTIIPRGGFPISTTISRADLHELCESLGAFAAILAPEPLDEIEAELASL